MAWRRLPCFCCPGTIELCDICEGTCPGGQLLPCTLCLEVTSLSFTSTIPGCGPLTVDPLPKPVVIVDSPDDRPFYYVDGERFADSITDAGGPYRTITVSSVSICSGGGGLVGTLKYYLGDAACGDSPPYGNFLQEFTIDLPDACDLTPLYGEHSFTLPNGGGLPDITAELTIVISPGDTCAIASDCCPDSNVSQVLGFTFTGPSGEFLEGQLEWDGSQWVCTNRTNSSAPAVPALDTASVYIECSGTDWHLFVDGYFDELASTVTCLYTNAEMVSATAGGFTMSIRNPYR